MVREQVSTSSITMIGGRLALTIPRTMSITSDLFKMMATKEHSEPIRL
jgi:hypothetical protein